MQSKEKDMGEGKNTYFSLNFVSIVINQYFNNMSTLYCNKGNILIKYTQI